MHKEYQNIAVAVEDRVATLSLNRPAAGNAFTPLLKLELRDALTWLGTAPEVGAVVLTGVGKNFCVGGDISGFKERLEKENVWTVEEVVENSKLGAAIRECPKPVIAMVNGAAAGAGASLAFACDFRVVTPRSKFVMAFINIGLTGDCGGMYFLERLLGTGKMTELMMTGEPLTGADAAALGIARMVEEELEEAAYRLAHKMAHGPLAAYAAQKRMINACFMADYSAFARQEAEAFCAASRTADFAESVNAFLEKRKPWYRGV